MFLFRPTIILSFLVAATFFSTAMAGRKKRSCDSCKTSLHKCEKVCEDFYKDPTAYALCAQHTCVCEVGKDKFCRNSCSIGGAGSLCFY
ncbi:hypothetical protein C7974DRAFT_395855 [Boeremia exigua]|uniref:uncharacterized protein n=1 Tax=Boeremia exigua TaxID=749465 RepID=UPI001E8EABA5|nr:uncharacterized protein C7974DRAFT_395855 [Boeremia exigua]KAH6625315.1 hypothetical protein C7974DRAFT_395855 [Boeremia exigua]